MICAPTVHVDARGMATDGLVPASMPRVVTLTVYPVPTWMVARSLVLASTAISYVPSGSGVIDGLVPAVIPTVVVKFDPEELNPASTLSLSWNTTLKVPSAAAATDGLVPASMPRVVVLTVYPVPRWMVARSLVLVSTAISYVPSGFAAIDGLVPAPIPTVVV